MLPPQALFFLVGDCGEEDGFQVYPEEESGVDFLGVGDVVLVEEGGGQGVVLGEAELVGADVGFCVVGVFEEGGGDVVGD